METAGWPHPRGTEGSPPGDLCAAGQASADLWLQSPFLRSQHDHKSHLHWAARGSVQPSWACCPVWRQNRHMRMPSGIPGAGQAHTGLFVTNHLPFITVKGTTACYCGTWKEGEDTEGGDLPATG